MATTSPASGEALHVLLLENIHASAVELLRAEGFVVEHHKGALAGDALAAALAGADLVGIRSKTQLRAAAISAAAPRLLSIGCFCIGTNQVDVADANLHGIPVFNAPFSNTRSVAELVIAEVVALARQLADRSGEVHRGVWRKASDGCHEVRGKTIGIVGYGHIGSQVGVLAEAMGMRVLFFDIKNKLPMGNNRPVGSLDELLAASDFVTLHVPETPDTRNMIRDVQLARMRQGAHLLNLSRGTVVDLDALAAALRAGRLGGAAIDVYPEEPEKNSDGFKSPLLGLPNVVLTPHVGGSTEEAQESIGREVALSLVKFATQGATTGAVNFPEVELPQRPGSHRILNVHKNVPGVLRDINKIISDCDANIERQVLATDPHIGYLIMDINAEVSAEVLTHVSALPNSIKTRVLF
jgi:D-3-phosphoglycerate dehydrogenase